MEVRKNTSKQSRKRPSPDKHLPANDREKKRKLKLLEELIGSGQGIWNEDAQEYVNRLRGNDRF